MLANQEKKPGFMIEFLCHWA